MSRARAWTIAVCGAVAVLLGGGVAVAAPSMTAGTAMSGNPKGIKLARAVMKAFAHIPAFAQTEQHYFQIKSNARAGTLYYRFGVPHRTGFYWAGSTRPWRCATTTCCGGWIS